MDFISIILKWVSTKIDSCLAWVIVIYKVYFMPPAVHFEEYRERLYKKYGIINTLALNNSQKLLKKIYVPQTLVKEDCSVKKDKYTKIDKYPEKLIKKYKRILITDSAGMGKSTIMKRMFIDLVEKKIESIDIPIPIYIELNKLDKDHTILDIIQEELTLESGLSSEIKKYDSKLLLKLIKKGSFVFFMDGYDEISNAIRTDVTNGIRNFISVAGDKHYYILTSRPGLSLAGFDDFHVFKIQPLTIDEAYKLLSKYDSTEKKSVSRNLINELKSGKYNSIVECLNNPMLVSLLFFVFKNKKTLKQHYFFDEIYNTYFRDHDDSKVIDPHEKQSDLDSYSFNQVLRCVAYVCLTSGKNEFDERLILKAISYAKGNCSNSNFGETAYLNDLLLAVPFFLKEGTQYKWIYKPLMEYFSALFLADDVMNHDKCLKEVCDNAPFELCVSMLDMYQEVDSKRFSVSVVKPLCEKFIVFYDSKKAIINGTKVNRGIVNARIGLLFHFDNAKLGIVNNTLYNNERTMKEFIKLRNLPDCHFFKLSSSKDAYLVACSSDNHPLLIRLYQIMPSLYAKLGNNTDYNAEDLNSAFCPYEISGYSDKNNLNDINERTGEEKEEVYMIINELLVKSLDYGQRINPLDYQECYNEILRIKKIKIQNINAIDDLLRST